MHMFPPVFWWITHLIDFDIRGFLFFFFSFFFLRLYTCRWEKSYDEHMAFLTCFPSCWPSPPLELTIRWQNEALAHRASIIIKWLDGYCDEPIHRSRLQLNIYWRERRSAREVISIIVILDHQMILDHNFVVNLGTRVWWISTQQISADRCAGARQLPVLISPSAS